MVLIALGFVLQAEVKAQFVSAEQEARLLSARLGHEVLIAKPLRSEFLYIAPHGTSLETEAKAVAEALHASLTKTPSRWLIQRKAEEHAAFRDARTVERATWIRRALQDRLAQRAQKLAGRASAEVITSNLKRALRPQPGRSTSQEEDIAAGQGLYDCELLLPGAILLESIIKRLTLERLASIPSGDFRVYETDRIAPAEELPDLNDLIASYSRSMQPFENSPVAPDVKERAVGVGGAFLTGFGLASNPVKTRLMVTTALNGLTINLELFDKSGSRIGLDSMYISRPDVPLLADVEARKVAEQGKSAWVPVSEAATKCASFRFHRGEFPDWLMHPEQIEPLSLFVVPGLAWIAQQTADKCVVFDVPESCFEETMQLIKADRLDGFAFAANLHDADLMESRPHDHYVVWRSRDPEWVELNRSDRKALGSFSRGVAKTKWIDPREEGLLFHRCRALSYVWRAAARLGLDSGTSGTQPPPNSNPLMAVIGEISDSQWQSLEAGRALTVGELGISHEVSLTLSLEPDIAGGGPLTDLFRHPLEMYADYRLEDTPISLRVQPQEVVQLTKDSFFGEWCPVAELPLQMTHDGLGIKRTPELTRDALEGFLDKNCLFNVGRRGDATITVGLPQGHYIQQHMQMPIETISKGLTYSQMPQALRDSVWDMFTRRVRRNGGGQ